jgi:hypothetical protein
LSRLESHDFTASEFSRQLTAFTPSMIFFNPLGRSGIYNISMSRVQKMSLRISHKFDVRLIDSFRERLPISAFDLSENHLDSLITFFRHSNLAGHELSIELQVAA